MNSGALTHTRERVIERERERCLEKKIESRKVEDEA